MDEDSEYAQLYAEKPEWSDVEPLSQYEGVNPLVPIFYSEEYKDATDYFRGIVKNGEMSDRVLNLTEHIIRLNPAHYSAWQYRYKTLLALNSPLDIELRLMDEIAIRHLKTYQVWHHRRLLLTLLKKPAPELAFIAESLKVDDKNYHTWSYRQWVLSYFNEDTLWEGEVQWLEGLLDADVRNNSAWSHRFFVVFGCGVRKGDEDREGVVKRELLFVKDKIALAPNNASAWNYLRGVLELNRVPFSTVTRFVEPYALSHPSTSTVSVEEGPHIVTSAEEELGGNRDLENPRPSAGAQLPCVAGIEFLADVYEAEGQEGLSKATALWRSLADEHDTIRKKYWEHRIHEAKLVLSV